MSRTRLRGLSIAGIQIGVEVPEPCEWDWPENAIQDHACLPREPEVQVGLRIGAVTQTDLAGERYALGASTFEIARRGEDWLIGLSRGGERRQIALFDADFAVGEVVQSPDWAAQRRYPLAGGLDEWIVFQRSVLRGGICLSGAARAVGRGAEVELAVEDPGSPRGWQVAIPSLLGRRTLVLRQDDLAARVHRTPWSTSVDESLPASSRIVGFSCLDAGEVVGCEILDPADAAEILVQHAVIPLCDERVFDRVLRNARQIADAASMVRRGRSGAPGIAVERRTDLPLRPLVPLRNAL